MHTPIKTDEVVALVLTKALEAAQTTGEFVKEQLPDVVQQLIMWNLVSSIMTVAVAVVVSLCFWRGHLWAKKRCDTNSYNNEGPVMFWIIGGMLTVCTTVGGILSLFEIAKILVAPKVWLLEYTANLIARGS